VHALPESWGYRLYGFDPATGEPAPLREGMDSLTVIALPE
jgi:hypothetical protein